MRSEKAFAVTNTGDIKMSGKFLARASALSLAVFLAACGGDENSTPIVNVNTGQDDTSNEGETTSPGGADTGETTPPEDGTTNPGEETQTAAILLGTGEGDNFNAEQLFLTSPQVAQGEAVEFPLTLWNSDTEDFAFNSGITVTYVSRCLDAGTAVITGASATSASSGQLGPVYTALPAVELEPGQASCYGQDRIHAFLDDPTQPAASGTILIDEPAALVLSLTAYDLSTMTPGAANTIKTSATTLPRGSAARLTVGIVDLNNGSSLQKGSELTVNFQSVCADNNQNTSNFEPASVTTTTGIAETIFTAGECGGANPQEITATLEGAPDVTASVRIDVLASSAFQLSAGLPNPMSIAPSDQSEDGRPASSLVTFTLEDQYGEPEASKNVTLTVDQTGTAEFFDAQTGSWEDSITLSTDAETGEVAARVRAKAENDHTQFRVIATYENLKAYSKTIVINSTLPSQNNFSLTSDNYAPDTWTANGVTSSLTIFAADIMGNRIRENTYVNFKTNEGSINPDCVITDGKCTVTWESLDTSQPYATITASTHGRISSTQTGTIESTIRLLMSTNENIT